VSEISDRAENPFERIRETVLLDATAAATSPDRRFEPRPGRPDPASLRSKGERNA
jgi:hypothetical protein